MSEDVLSLIRRKIREEMNELADHLATGGAQNMEEYRKVCGMIEGLAWTEREVIDIEGRISEL